MKSTKKPAIQRWRRPDLQNAHDLRETCPPFHPVIGHSGRPEKMNRRKIAETPTAAGAEPKAFAARPSRTPRKRNSSIVATTAQSQAIRVIARGTTSSLIR